MKNLSQSARVVVLAGLAIVYACGPQQSNSEFEANGSFTTEDISLNISTSSEAVRVTVCKRDGNQCAANSPILEGLNPKTVGQKLIFTINGKVTPASGMNLLIIVYKTGNAELSRRSIQLVAAGTTGAGNGLPAGGLWKAVLMTGDDSISAFDNARSKVQSLITERGVPKMYIRELSMSSSQQTNGVLASSEANLEAALKSLSLTANDGCFVYLTSHGSREGFFLKGQNTITPASMGRILDNTCGQRPTVVLVSACYSGVMIDQGTKKDNRIFLTAASKDRTSFGCSAEFEYTYWDGCLIENFSKSQDWQSLYKNVTQCIETKESAGGNTPSQPQSYFGTQIASMGIFGVGAAATGTGASATQVNGIASVPATTTQAAQTQLPQAKDFTITNELGSKPLSQHMAGVQYALVDVSASWCGACANAMGSLAAKLAAKPLPENCRIFTIMDKPTELGAWLQRFSGKPAATQQQIRNISFSATNGSSDVERAFNVNISQFPTMFLIDGQGNVVGSPDASIPETFRQNCL